MYRFCSVSFITILGRSVARKISLGEWGGGSGGAVTNENRNLFK